MRRLRAKWLTNTGWPKRLDYIELKGIRGWTGQRFNLDFPIMAIVGENGSGKSTILQCAASVYATSEQVTRSRYATKSEYASDFFPDTAWEKIRNASIAYSLREGMDRYTDSVRKPGERWRGNPERRSRAVEYIDLSRIVPISVRRGYARIAKPQFKEAASQEFDQYRLGRFSQIMGRQYDLAKMAATDADPERTVSVLTEKDISYSGFHSGAGETTIAEFLEADFPKYGLVLIDEVETSLHPRAQRRLVRDLAERCRERELQIVITTHSPYVLDELPLEARAYIIKRSGSAREIVYGVSSEFAMSKMDDVAHTECDLFVEDERAATLVTEILTYHRPNLVHRCRTVPYGAASVGRALGIMNSQNRWPRPTCVFLDADAEPAAGCTNLPGKGAPEIEVFGKIGQQEVSAVSTRTGRQFSDVADALAQATALDDHHEWVRYAASKLLLSSDTLWQAMCADWASSLHPEEANKIITPIEDVLTA
ncbi:ATP-dependent nuclease [Hansschlegelia beijingensis]|uniref:ATP-dependent nuclease n=1 Tax=Hansschlegelia beijingensis TaxID=1133344 RepID=UPI00387EF68E